MKTVEPMIREALNALPVERIGWVLVHFLWEGALVALLLAVLLHALEGRSAAERYAASLMALLGLAVLPVATWFMVAPAPEPALTAQDAGATLILSEAARSAVAVEPAATVGVEFSPAAVLAEVTDLLSPALPWIVAVWAIGVAMLSLRLAGGWALTQQLRRQGTEPVEAVWSQRFERLARRLGVPTSAQLLRSSRVVGPMTIGWWRPVVLVPGSVLTGLPPEQVEAILAHELAHVRRYDYLVGLAQAAIETLLFYHPAVWWVSDQVRQEREHCCDDLAVAACRNDRLTYARALAGLAGLRTAPALAMGAMDGSVVARIRRLVGDGPPDQARRPVLLLALLLVVTCAVAAQAVQPSPPASPPPPPAPEAWSFATPFAPAAPAPASPAPASPAPASFALPLPAPLAPSDTTRPDSARAPRVEVYFRGDSTRVFRIAPDASALRSFERSAEQWADSVRWAVRPLADSLRFHFSGAPLDSLMLELEKRADGFAFRFDTEFAQGLDSLRSFSFHFPEDFEFLKERTERMQGHALQWADSLNGYRFEVHTAPFPHGAADAEALEAEQEALRRAARQLEREAEALEEQAEQMREQGSDEAARALEKQSRVLERESRRLERQHDEAERRREAVERQRERAEEARERAEEARERAEEARERHEERRLEEIERMQEQLEEERERMEEERERERERMEEMKERAREEAERREEQRQREREEQRRQQEERDQDDAPTSDVHSHDFRFELYAPRVRIDGDEALLAVNQAPVRSDGYVYVSVPGIGRFTFSDRPFCGAQHRGRFTGDTVQFFAGGRHVTIEANRPIRNGGAPAYVRFEPKRSASNLVFGGGDRLSAS